MGLRFRRSIKLAPGIKINIGKTGVSSITAGIRGANATIGKKGTSINVGYLLLDYIKKSLMYFSLDIPPFLWRHVRNGA